MTTFNACAGMESSKPANESPDDNRLLKIKKLKARLINEEHRLVLMKKIRQSQTRPVVQQQQQPTPNALNAHSAHLRKVRPSPGGPLSMHKSSHLNPSSSSMNSSSPSATLSLTLASNNSSTSNNSLNQTPAHAHQRPKVNSLWNPPQQARHPTPVGIAAPHVGNLSRQPITTPPNVVQAMMGNLSSIPQSLLLNSINASAAAAAKRPSSSFNSNNNSNLSNSASKRPKQSLQKQIENALMPQSNKLGQSTGLNFNSANLNKRGVGVTSPHVGNLSRQPITTPPNVVHDMRGGLSSGQQSLLMNSQNNLSSLSSRINRNSQQQIQQSSFNKSHSGSGGSSMLIQKRSAAKAAIQRQLEQTLLQLPSKQLNLNIDFVPNANNIEFVYYVGLEACVDYLTNTMNPFDLQPMEKPFECSTCGTDFTPAWSWKRSNAVCENCVSNHVKKSIKNSQASRIKSVLTKAIKQEHEMDQRILAESNNPISSPVSSSSQQHPQHSLLQPSSHHHQQQPQHHQQHLLQTTQQRSSSQAWPRVSQNSPLNVLNSNSSNRASTTTTPAGSLPPVLNATNPLAGIPAIASLLQMNPQISALASLMNPNTAPPNSSAANTNQFAQAILQLTMNMFNRRT